MPKKQQTELAKASNQQPATLNAETTGQSSALAARAESEVKSAVLVAKQFPRDEDTAIQRIDRACLNPLLADKADYSYPRGGTQVQGPSIYLMRTVAQYWGNLDYGFHVIAETEEGALVRAYAWDMETNTRAERDHFVRRLVQRREGWVRPDERDFREWLGNIGSRLERRCLENVIPRHIVDSAREQATETRMNKFAKDPETARKKILAAFAELGVPAKELAAFLEMPVAQASGQQIDTLRGIYRAIKDGEKTWRDYRPVKETFKAEIDPSKLTEGTDPNRGHDDTGLERARYKARWREPFNPEQQIDVQAWLRGEHGLVDDEAIDAWVEEHWNAGTVDMLASAKQWLETHRETETVAKGGKKNAAKQ